MISASIPSPQPTLTMTAAVSLSRGSSAVGGLPPRSSPSASSTRPTSASSSAPPNASASPATVTTASGRPLLGFRLSCPPSSLGLSYHLLDVDSLDKSSGDSEYRRQKLPHFDSERLTLSGGFQAQPTQQSVATQTAPRQQRSAICQYEVQRLPAAECDAVMASAAMAAFLSSVHDRVLSELDKNRTLDVFKDEFALDDDEDDDNNSGHQTAGVEGAEQQNRALTAAGSKGDRPVAAAAGNGVSASGASLSRPSHSLSLFHSFHHLLYSRHHSVGWVDWHPSRCLVAFSLVPTWNFDQWCDHSGEVSLSYILLYDLSQLLMPLTIVKVPGVVTVFKFHPTAHCVSAASQQQQRAPGLPPATASSLFGPSATPLVAGLQTGQLILYLINTATGSSSNGNSAGQANSTAATSSGKHNASKAKTGNSGVSATAAAAAAGKVASTLGASTSHSVAGPTDGLTTANGDAAGISGSIPASSASAASAAASSSSFLSSLSSTSPADGSSVLPSPLYTLLSNLDRSHGRPVTDIHWLPAPHNINRKGERTFNPATATATSALFSSQLMSFAADGKILYWDYRQLNEHNQHSGSSSHYQQQQQQESEGWMSGTPEEWHEKRDGKWSPLFALPLHMASGHGGGGGDGHDDGAGSSSSSAASSVPNSFVRTSSSFPVSSLVTARKVALGPSLSSPLLVAVSEDGELLEIDTSARAGGGAGSDSSSSSSHSHSAPASVLRRCRAHTTVGVSIDRSAVLPSLYASCGESTFSLWHVGGERPVFVSPPCHSASYCAARWSPTRPAVLCLGRTDGVVEVWDCLDATHQPAYTFPTGSADAITALQFQPAANNQSLLTQTQSSAAAATGANSHTGGNNGSSTASSHSSWSSLTPFPLPLAVSVGHVPFPSAYSSSARQYLCCGDAGGKCHIIEMPRPLRRRMAGEDAAVLRWVERERRRGEAQQAAIERKSRGLTTATPYQQLSEHMPQLFKAHSHTSTTAASSSSSGSQQQQKSGPHSAAASNSAEADSDELTPASGSGSGSSSLGSTGTLSSSNGVSAAAAAADSAAEHEYAATVSQLLAALQAQAGKQAEDGSASSSSSSNR